MSLRAIPLILFVFILYNIIVLAGGQFGLGGDGADAHAMMAAKIFNIPMLNGNQWPFTWGDLIVLLLFGALFVELLKATYTSGTSLLDHGLFYAGVRGLPHRIPDGAPGADVCILLHYDRNADRRHCRLYDWYPGGTARSGNWRVTVSC